METTLTLISDQWKMLILRDLIPGTKRFGELKKSIGNVSQKVLTAQLRQMEDSGLLTRTVYPEVPPRVEYTLTDLGRSLKPILDAMWTWGENYKQINYIPDMVCCLLPEYSAGACKPCLFLRRVQFARAFLLWDIVMKGGSTAAAWTAEDRKSAAMRRRICAGEPDTFKILFCKCVVKNGFLLI